jgi:hypothetical protein
MSKDHIKWSSGFTNHFTLHVGVYARRPHQMVLTEKGLS